MLQAVDGPVPDEGTEALALVDELAAAAEPGLTAMGSGRYFGFVIGGALPASLAADWLVSAWDQNAGLAQPTPAVAALETVTGRWVLELLGLPRARVLRVRHGLPDGSCHLPRSGAPGPLRADRVRPARGGPRGCAPASRRRRGEAPRHADPRAAAARNRPRPGAGRAGRRPGEDARRAACRCPRKRDIAHDRVRPGRRGEHGSVRRPGADRRRLARARRLGPRRRRVRPLGRREPALRLPRPWSRRSGLVGDRRSQVAQRPVRLRHRDLRPSRDACGRDGVRRPVPGGRRRGRA